MLGGKNNKNKLGLAIALACMVAVITGVLLCRLVDDKLVIITGIAGALYSFNRLDDIATEKADKARTGTGTNLKEKKGDCNR